MRMILTHHVADDALELAKGGRCVRGLIADVSGPIVHERAALLE